MNSVDKKTINRIRKKLNIWGKKKIVKYPWRYRSDPYMILVSEFMLHRTQARQVIPIYQDFLESYPSIGKFYHSDTKDIKKKLKSLGLSWRIDGMIKALREIFERYGSVPVEYNKLVSIRGIGQYIAGATVCFSTNTSITLVDTNTVRVAGRLLGLDLSGEARRRKEIVLAIGELADPDNPRDFYYSIIDLAHSICIPRKPSCDSCPLLKSPCYFGYNLFVES